MPLKTPFSATNKSDTNPKGKAAPPAKAKASSAPAKGKDGGKPSAPKKGKLAPPPAPPPPTPTIDPFAFWNNLSPERKLDVVGAIMAVIGLFIVLIFLSAQRSNFTGGMLRALLQSFGWG